MAMDRGKSIAKRAAVSGYGVQAQYADSAKALVAAIEQGKKVKGTPFLTAKADIEMFKMAGNPLYVPHPAQPTAERTFSIAFVQGMLENVIQQALMMAGCTEKNLQGEGVRVYISCTGMRADMADFFGYQDCNDKLDLRFNPQIQRLSAQSYGQDVLMSALSERYRLSCAPTLLYCASSSSMATLHLAQKAIAQGVINKALVIGWTNFTLQDLFFLGLQGLLSSSGKVQPFSSESAGMLLSNGAAAVLLESETSAWQRGQRPDIFLHHTVMHQSGGTRSGLDFRGIAATMQNVLEQAELAPEAIGCVFPHGNGIYSGDKSEAMALLKLWGENGVPVVTYKGQIGYFSTCSSLLDIMIAADALRKKRVLAFNTHCPLDEKLTLRFHADQAPLPLHSPHILKTAIGLDGSVVAGVISRDVGDVKHDRLRGVSDDNL